MTAWTWFGSMIGDDVEHLNEELREELTALHDDARRGRWETVLEADREERLNVWRPGDGTCAAPLHVAAATDADAQVVNALVARGAWRTLRTVGGRRPVDIARARRASEDVLEALEPAPLRPVRPVTLALWQHHVAEVVRQVSGPLACEFELRVPEVSVLTEMPDGDVIWFPIPMMLGGFRLELAADGVLVSSWSRMVEGSLMRHLVSDSGVQVLEGDMW